MTTGRFIAIPQVGAADVVMLYEQFLSIPLASSTSPCLQVRQFFCRQVLLLGGTTQATALVTIACDDSACDAGPSAEACDANASRDAAGACDELPGSSGCASCSQNGRMKWPCDDAHAGLIDTIPRGNVQVLAFRHNVLIRVTTATSPISPLNGDVHHGPTCVWAIHTSGLEAS